MGKRQQALLSELLALPSRDRRAILEEVLQSITPEQGDDDIEAELDSRWNDVLSGKVKMLSRDAMD